MGGGPCFDLSGLGGGGGGGRHGGGGWLGLALAGLVAVVLLLLLASCGRARAHDPVTGEANWIAEGSYRGADGVHCCGPNDCEPLAPGEVEARPDGLWLPRFRELVPWAEATPSEDGRYWRCHNLSGARRCFFAPVGTQ